MDFVKQVKFNEKYSRLQDPEMVIRSLMQDGVSYYLVNDSKPDAFYRLSSGSPTKKILSVMFLQITINHLLNLLMIFVQ